MNDPVYQGFVSPDGKLSLVNKRGFEREVKRLASLDRDVHVDLIIRKHRKTRSNRQNRFYRGHVVPVTAEAYGYLDDEDMHNAWRVRFLMITDDVLMPTVRSTTSLSTVEWEEYIEKIRIAAASEMGCEVKYPNEVDMSAYEAAS